MIFAEFTHLCDRFRRVSTPDRLPDEWVSPYRLLWGAAYSVGIAENALENESGADFALPLDLSSSLKLAVEGNDADSISWLPRWRASYMLTNAVFRVAAATEKICYLADPDLQWDRGKLWDALRNPNSSLSTKVPIAPKLLGHMPSLKDRASYLDGQREVFHGPQTRGLQAAQGAAL